MRWANESCPSLFVYVSGVVGPFYVIASFKTLCDEIFITILIMRRGFVHSPMGELEKSINETKTILLF